MSEYTYHTEWCKLDKEGTVIGRYDVEVGFSGLDYSDFLNLRHIGEWSFEDKDEIKSLVALDLVMATIRDHKIIPRQVTPEALINEDDLREFVVYIPSDVPKEILDILDKIMGRLK